MNDDLTTRLNRELHDQADGLQGAPLTLESVRGRARSIRRARRLTAAGIAAVAVAAILVPTALISDVTGRTDRDPAPVDTPSEVVDDASALGVPYLADRVLRLPDGTEQALLADYQSAFVLGDQVFGLSQNPGSLEPELSRLADNGTTESLVPLASGVVGNADGSAIAYTTRGGRLMIEWADGEVDLGEVGAVRPIRLLGGPDCTMGVDDCVVYYEDGRTTRFLNNAGEGAEVAEDALEVQDVSANGLLSVLTSVEEREPGSCSEIRDVQTSEPVYETCDHTPSRFSPDGTYLSALPPYLSGIGPTRIAILDAASGKELSAVEPENGYVDDSGSVWEDPEHLLVMTYDFAGTWDVVRLGADGSQQRVLGPTEGGETDPPWVLVGPGA